MKVGEPAIDTIGSIHLVVHRAQAKQVARPRRELRIAVELGTEHEHELEVEAKRPAVGEAIGLRPFEAQADHTTDLRFPDHPAVVGGEGPHVLHHLCDEDLPRRVLKEPYLFLCHAEHATDNPIRPRHRR